MGSAGPLCVSKKSGELSFTLTTKQLNISLLDVALEFKGEADPSGLPQVTWRVNKDLDQWVSLARVTHIGGSIVTQVDTPEPTLDESCAGEQRVVQATIATVGTQNALAVDTSLGTIDCKNITIATPGRAGEILDPVFFDLSSHVSHWERTECGDRFQLVGSTVTCTVLVENLQAVGTVTATTFDWAVPAGVTPLSPTTAPSITLRIDAPGNFQIAVDVVVGTGIQTGTRKHTVKLWAMTAADANTVNMACHLKHIAQAAEQSARAVVGVGAGVTLGDGTRLVDPLYDPPKGEEGAALARVIAEHQFEEVRRTMRLLVDAANQVTRAAQVALTERVEVWSRVR